MMLLFQVSFVSNYTWLPGVKAESIRGILWMLPVAEPVTSPPTEDLARLVAKRDDLLQMKRASDTDPSRNARASLRTERSDTANGVLALLWEQEATVTRTRTGLYVYSALAEASKGQK